MFLKLSIVTSEFRVSHICASLVVKEQLPELEDHQILKEPLRRNTAPCIAYVSSKIYNIDPQANLVVAPSDHLVMNGEEFTRIITKALVHVTKSSDLLTLGIVPTRPDTGYGYIQYDEGDESDGFYKVKTFTEKPDLELANQFISSGDFLWNSGIFVWNVKAILAAFNKHLHDVYEVFHEGQDLYNTPKEQEFINQAYTMCTNISIDYGVMEKSDSVRVIPSDFGWSDLGTWASAYDNLEKDYLENAVAGNNVMVIDATNNMVHALHIGGKLWCLKYKLHRLLSSWTSTELSRDGSGNGTCRSTTHSRCWNKFVQHISKSEYVPFVMDASSVRN